MKKITKLKLLRQGVGLTIINLSHRTGIHPSTISMIERRRQASSARAREIISSFLGIPQEEAFDSEGFAVLAKK